MSSSATSRIAVAVILAMLIILLAAVPLGATPPRQPVGERPAGATQDAPSAGAFAPGRILVRWQADTAKHDKERALAAEDLALLSSLEPLGTDVLAVSPGQELATIAQLEASGLVGLAEPDYLAYAVGESDEPVASPGYNPDDTYWIDLWNQRRVLTPLAWELATGSWQTVVAIVDSGIDLNHPELAGRVMPGYDYVNKDSFAQDDYGHGSNMAGIIAATGDNRRGVAGVAWNVRLLPLKALDNRGQGFASDVALAVLNATQQKADVINLSLALTGPSETVHDAILMADSSGSVVVGATGNAAGAVSYPAAYPEVIAVAASTHWDQPAGYANFGPQVDVAAPGGEQADQIRSIAPYGGYSYNYGTSLGAAHVSGLVALMRSVAPEMSKAAILSALRDTADKVGSVPYVGGRNDRMGYGRINANKALRKAWPPQLQFDRTSLSSVREAGDLSPIGSFTFSNPSSQSMTWEVKEISQDWLDVSPPWTGSLAYPDKAILQVRLISSLPVGSHDAVIRLRATSAFGQQQDYTLPVHIRVASPLHTLYLPIAQKDSWSSGWVDGRVGGSALALDNDGAQRIDLPFSFPFYGLTYQSVWVHANGFLSFDRSYSGSQYANNICVPGITLPNAAIYPLWDDLDPGAGGSVYVNATGGESFLVQWQDVPRREGGGTSTFQVILWPDGRVLLQYQSVAVPNGATVGTENWDATMGWRVACNGSGSPPVAGSSHLLWTSLPQQR